MADGFMSFLDKVGDVFKKIFTGVTEVARLAEPIVDTAFPEIGGLYNFTVQQASLAEAAAAGVSGQGTKKLAAVLAAVAPYATAALAKNGVPAMTTEQLTNYVNAVVASLNAIPAPVLAGQSA